jgi:hypothetical protein
MRTRLRGIWIPGAGRLKVRGSPNWRGARSADWSDELEPCGGSAELRKKVGEHVEAAVKRSKNKPPWTEAHGRSLMAVLDRACELAVHGNSSEAKLFSKYEGTLAGDDAGRLRAAREEGILRAVLAMLAKMRRAMKMEGQAQ